MDIPEDLNDRLAKLLGLKKGRRDRFLMALSSVPGLKGLVSDTTKLIQFAKPWEETDDTKPLALCWHISTFKRETLHKYWPDHRVVYVNKNVTVGLLKQHFPELLEDEHTIHLIWGAGGFKDVQSFAQARGHAVYRVEDGFLRSFTPGALHSTPYSLVFDKVGLYFDTRHESELERLLNFSPKIKDPDMLDKARAGLTIFRAARLSKYVSYLLDSPEELESDEEENNVLLVGQIESDASVHYGRGTARTFHNRSLAQEVDQRFSDSKLFFKPHPDTVRKKNKRSNGGKDARQFEIVSPLEPLPHVLQQMDKVVTFTSLVGMEALILNKEVVTYGQPFYAGWGLTNDQQTLERRKRKLSVEELFAATYLLYPRYLHPDSDELTDYFTLAGHFFVEQLKYTDLTAIPEYMADMEALREVEESLPPAARLLIYLSSNGRIGMGNIDEILAVAGDDPHPRDFAQFSHLLIATSNYDALKVYADRALRQFENNLRIYQANSTLVTKFYTAYAFAQRNSNGRVLADPKDAGETLVKWMERDPKYLTAIVEYARCLSNNLRYDELEGLLQALAQSPAATVNLLQRIGYIITLAPSRSERRHDRRRALKIKIIRLYRQALDERYSSSQDLFVNAALEARMHDEPDKVVHTLEVLVESLGVQLEKGRNFSASKWRLLARRPVHFFLLYDYLLKSRRFQFAENLLRTIFYPISALPPNATRLRDLWIMLFSARGDHRSVLKTFDKRMERAEISDRAIRQYARALRGLGELRQSRAILKRQRENASTPTKRLGIDAELQKLDFAIETSEILSSYPQPRMPKGVVFLASQTCYNTLAMMTPSLYELKKKGYAFVNLMEGMTAHEATGIDFIDKFAGAIPMQFFGDSMNHDWQINWNAKEVIASDINFYQGFYERLSTQTRTFHVDLNQDAVNRSFITQLRRTDHCLTIAEQIFREVVGRGVTATLVTGNSHVTPFSVFRDYARTKDHPRLNFINCNVAYENYFSNLGGKFASTMAVTDMTLHRNRRAPFFALPDQFESWFQENRKNPEFRERAERMIYTDRSSVGGDEISRSVVADLERRRAKGQKILCVFGKVPVDLNVPYDGGPGHEDMADWLNHTVEIARANPHLYLLVKPHPHELKPEIALDLVDGFADLITSELPENVHVLDHRDINAHALSPLLDLALLYNGSSALELTTLGVPVMMAAWFGQYDYPVDLIYPDSREQYEQFLAAGDYPKPDQELREKAAYLISYMGTSDVAIRNEYSLRQITNDKVGIPRWRRSAVEGFLRYGDPEMERAANRIVEKFEGSEGA